MTKAIFQQAEIEGDIVVWREVLVEGPVAGDIQEPEFWKNRKTFIELAYTKNYDEFVLTEIDKLQDLGKYKEVVLWFEYDLFCHVNMLGCLTFIDHPNSSLICLGDEFGGKFQGLGEIDPSDYSTLYLKRKTLSLTDISYAREAWMIFQNKDIKQMEPFMTGHSTFQYLGRAFSQLNLLQPYQQGLNALQIEMQQLKEESLDNKKIIGTMLKRHTWLGFGDLQYWTLLQSI